MDWINHTQKTGHSPLAAQAADPNDAASAKLMAKTAVAKRAMAAATAPATAPGTATIDMDQPAPALPIDEIFAEATVEASATIESPDTTAPAPADVLAKTTPAKKPAPKKPAAKKTTAGKTPAAKNTTTKATTARKTAAKTTATRKPATKTATKTAASKITAKKPAAKVAPK